jgi:hypothetical protein
MMWGGGLYGRPPSPDGLPLSSRIARRPRATQTPSGGWNPAWGAGKPQTAPIKAYPTHPNHPRPYGILGWRLRLTPIGRTQRM